MWNYIFVFNRIYRFIYKLNKRSNRILIAHSAILSLSFSLTLLIDQLFRYIENHTNFDYLKYHMFIVLGVFYLTNLYLVFYNPGLNNIEEKFMNESKTEIVFGSVCAIIISVLPIIMIVI